ncbi:hypothetical protein MOF05_08830 [Bacillus haynesii]|uniref:hypothetical protein n=1 Tax=Bacillus haynesii TaxID=1925021 RepID=UPI0022802B37|nr:hypothetical protein [Bacillus haynesii]MCY9288495.1 hypothetical protein [Bacillus haynesii]
MNDDNLKDRVLEYVLLDSDMQLFQLGFFHNKNERGETMTFLVLMVGLFLFIYMKEPFSKKVYAYVYVAFYLMVLALYIINTTFVNLISSRLLLIVTEIVISPLFISFLKSSNESR